MLIHPYHLKGVIMARFDNVLLDTGDNLPDFDLHLVSGKKTSLHSELGSGYTAVFFYRGHW